MMATSRLQLASHDPRDTHEFGRTLGSAITGGIVLGLIGPLGSGKTEFVRGLASGLGIDPRQVISPTFVLCVPYAGRLELWHSDAYRIDNVQEFDQLGLDDALASGAVLVIEWADRVAAWLPADHLQIVFDETEEENCRSLTVSSSGPESQHVVQRWLELLPPATPQFFD